MKKVVFWFLIAAALVLAAVIVHGVKHSTANQLNPGNKPVVKIGMIGPLTGQHADLGQAQKLGVQIALNKINRVDAKYHYEVVIDDNAFDAAKTAVIARKMMTFDKPLMIMGMGSGNALVINSVLGDAPIFQFATVNNPDVSKRRFSHNYYMHPGDTASKLVERMRYLGTKNINIFAANTAASEAVLRYLTPVLEEKGIAFWVVSFNPTERDFRLTIYKAFQKQVDMSIILAQPPTLEILVHQLREYDPKLKLATTYDALMSGDLDLLENIWFVGKETPSSLRATIDDSKLPSSWVAHGYEIALLFTRLVESLPYNDGQVDIQALEEKIRMLKDYDIDGTRVTTDEDGFISYDISYHIFRGGKNVALEEVEGGN